MVLILALLLVKENRNWQAWLILIPLLLALALWQVIAKIFSLPSSAAELFGLIFLSLATGLAVLWLLGQRVGGRNRAASFFMALGTMVIMAILSCLCQYGMSFSKDLLGASIYYGVAVLTVLLGLSVAGFSCRKRYNVKRFLLWQLLWFCVLPVIFVLVAAGSVMILGAGVEFRLYVLLQITLVGVVIGAILYVMLLPYIILAVGSRFFYERFYVCLHLKSMPVPVGAVAGAEQAGGEQPAPRGPENSDSE